MMNGFHMGGALRGPLAGPLPVANGLLPTPGLRVVLRQEFRLRLGGVLDQRMLERVGRLGRDTALVHEFDLHQLP